VGGFELIYAGDRQDAFSANGPGSTVRRAKIIADDVYAQVAPVPQALRPPDLSRPTPKWPQNIPADAD
jgi:hypothetical protein